MAKKLFGLIVVMLLLSASGAWAAGSVASNFVRDSKTGLTKYIWDWTSDASGDVSGEGSMTVTGTVAGVWYVPDSGGTQPTNAYDVTLTTSEPASFDVLVGTGANLSNTPSDSGNFTMPLDNTNNRPITLYKQTLTPTVSNAGNAKGGKIIILVF